MVIELEALAIQRVVELMATDIVDSNRERHGRAIVRLGLIHVVWARRRPVFVFFEEVQCCLDVMRFLGDGHGGFLR